MLLFFFSLIPRLPTPTLFPYTTLFRSYSGVISVFATALSEGRRPTIFGDGEQTRDFTYVANVVDGVLRACEAPRDRKSTRLNSSHTVISYAVFCLKKKKKNNV